MKNTKIDSKKEKPKKIYSIFLKVPFCFVYFFGLIEFCINLLAFGHEKISFTKSSIFIGLIFMIIGIFVRQYAIRIFYQKTNPKKNDDPEKKKTLITEDIYHYFRHPQYFGVLFFSIGSELFQQNIITAIIATAIVWKYLSDVIQEEETKLVAYFGNEYVSYRGSTPSYIPYID